MSPKQDDSPRRETYIEHDAVYAEAGASAASDLMRFPPKGSTPFENVLKLGSGADRFLTASNILMTWGAQRASGISVFAIEEINKDRYTGILFDEQGLPEVSPESDVRYGPDGEAFLTAGTTASFSWPGGKITRKMRVVYVTDESRQAGFALGTADDAGVIGEAAYLVEHRDDDSVWAIARGFYSAPSNGLLGLRARTMIRLAIRDATQQISVLVPGAVSVADLGAPASESE